MRSRGQPLIHGQGCAGQTYPGVNGKSPCSGICRGHTTEDTLYSDASHPGPHDSQKDKDKYG